AFIKQRLFPAISHILDIDKFLSLLLSDFEPLPWFVSNGAIRAAQIMVLANKRGIEASQIIGALKSRESEISRGFMKPSIYREKPSLYIERLAADVLSVK